MIIQGDALAELRKIEPNTVDAVVTDPPYELGFMGKKWDASGIAYNVEMWRECLRVLKPGGHLLAFGGCRTYHRMACAIEDAGFEVRDMIEWVYGSGFPKSLNIGKAVDKKPKCDEVKNWKTWLKTQIDNCPKTKQQINDECGFTATSYVKIDNKDYWSSNLPKNGKWQIMKKVIGITTDKYDWVEQDNCEERGYVEPTGGLAGGSGNTVGCFTGKQLSNNSIDERAKQYEGWGTALKPAHEPICMARKPLSEKTVAENCLKWGTGGINIDESRVETSDDLSLRYKSSFQEGNSQFVSETATGSGKRMELEEPEGTKLGRFPANLIHDNSEEVRECFPETGQPGNKRKTESQFNGSGFGVDGKREMDNTKLFYDAGNASRFFKSIIYTAKASKAERNAGCEQVWNLFEQKEGLALGEAPASARSKPAESRQNALGEPRPNNHPTVKPIALMEYLINMVSRKGDVILDPFAGSGTTGVACKNLNRRFILIEKEKEYCEIAERRVGHEWRYRNGS